MNKQPLILVSHYVPDQFLGDLYQLGSVVMGPPTTETEGLSPAMWELLPEADAIFTLLSVNVDEAFLQQAQKLKVISQMAVGVNNIDLEACTQHGIPVGHTPGVLTDATADAALALLLAVARRLPETTSDAREGRWAVWEPDRWLGFDLVDKRMGIIGMGRIGRAIARRVQGFGMEVVYHNRSQKPQVEASFGVTYLSLDELLETSDVVSLNMPLTDQTYQMIGDRELSLMKERSILINTARGAVVDTNALVSALRNKQIWGAGLDVVDPEPLPTGHPLYELPNCVVTPHIGSATLQTRIAMARLAVENLKAGLRGEKLPNQAN